MENKYEILVNLTKEMKKVYEKYYETEGYQFLVKEDTILFVKKQNTDKLINLTHEKDLIRLIQSMATKYPHIGIFYLDLTKEINSILQQSEEKKELHLTDNYITWPIRQAITKAISHKNNSQIPKV